MGKNRCMKAVKVVSHGYVGEGLSGFQWDGEALSGCKYGNGVEVMRRRSGQGQRTQD
jgi:hypothetical protein